MWGDGAVNPGVEHVQVGQAGDQGQGPGDGCQSSRTRVRIERVDNSPKAVKRYSHKHVGGAGDPESLAEFEYFAKSIGRVPVFV